MQIRLKRDDGAILYLNGDEIHRSNMPDGQISFETNASGTVGGNDEDTFFSSIITDFEFYNGYNVFAVEVIYMLLWWWRSEI